ncbi:2-hydroxy-3-oxopropionate reductase [mine drainage metagenome]|uniref:2-hydroxy-3-oxopropionate reductase n=1 Tax=mine drainage metagenome TaxID=410659 RepID=A0A1J5PSV7_9ZZZZ
MAEVAMLGTGRMGSAMARRIVLAGHQLVIWNRSRPSADELASDVGSLLARVADTAAEAAAGAQFIISSLANGDATQAVLLDPTFLASLRPDSIVCDMGTSGISSALAVSNKFEEVGHLFVDAPVSGSVATADAGQLFVMASGDESAVSALKPILMTFSKQVTYLGVAGNGQAMKLAVNLVVHSVNAALSEAFVFASQAGISPEDAYGVFEDSVVGSAFIRYKRQAFLTDQAPVAMTLDLVKKDLGLISSSAAQLDLNLSVTNAVASLVDESCDAGFGSRDMADLSKFLSQALPSVSS